MSDADSIHVLLKQAGPIPLDVSLACNTGEILVILGPSGSGKTTILRAISGLYTPEFGNVRCNGEQWLDTAANINLPVQQRHIGMVFQHYALFPHKTAVQNIMLPLTRTSYKQKRAAAENLLRTMNMQGLEERYPHQLSGGQQQRVALARALARDPGVLLLDEPFSAVDQQTRRKLVRELVSLRQRFKLPIIHVTHDLNEARRIADRLCIIHHGKTLQIDTPDQVMNHPDNADIASLIGHYNIFEGEVSAHDHDAKTTHIEWYGHTLTTRYRPEFEPHAEIDWVIPSDSIILHRRDRPSKGERENPVKGRIDELLPLGENASITIATEQDQLLYLSVPTHVARRNRLAQGGDISVSLLAERIHLMNKSEPLTKNEKYPQMTQMDADKNRKDEEP